MSTETTALPLIRAKLYRPRGTADLVRRPRLVQRLQQRRGQPLTLVSALAGYGTTTLVSSWRETIDQLVAWLFLDSTE